MGKQITIFFSYPHIRSHACAQLGQTSVDPLSQSWGNFLSIRSADEKKNKGSENENGVNRFDI